MQIKGLVSKLFYSNCCVFDGEPDALKGARPVREG